MLLWVLVPTLLFSSLAVLTKACRFPEATSVDGWEELASALAACRAGYGLPREEGRRRVHSAICVPSVTRELVGRAGSWWCWVSSTPHTAVMLWRLESTSWTPSRGSSAEDPPYPLPL